ncbi:OsmC family protein [Mesorhizobium denitrificans]|uniref:OsmC family peroxiredoxin n=1 Tax=Mesorhizobium denitrificans TaxID=2294114 RepID=A0A371X9J4_9HYPH|nr:OsmC family protein [Mesorhizobium denitrificans]RFC65861.1 OsmC family peroxiredoxin [Mesorhizobium denitrificans]
MQNQRRLPPEPLNGVDIPGLLATIRLVADQPELAQFQFRTCNEWVHGTHSRSAFVGFAGAGRELKHERFYFADTDHPAVLCGKGSAPTPVEWILHGLAGCLMAGIANDAAARGIRLTKVKCSVSGDIDLRGIFGAPCAIRNGFSDITVTFDISGEATGEMLEALVANSRARSAVFDILTAGVPISVNVRAQH